MVLPALKSFLIPKWTLVRALSDLPPPMVITGQFGAQDYEETIATVWASLAIPKRRTPHTQWARGEFEISTFGVRLWASNIFEDVKETIRNLKEATKPDPSLGRPPLWRFTWGDISFDCVVESIGGVRYDSLWPDGRIRGASLELTLRQIDDTLDLSPVDLSAPAPSTRYKPTISGDTYEGIALRHYRDPRVGILLRQDAEPAKAFPRSGDVVALPPASRFTRRRIRPTAYALSDADDAKAARIALHDLRSAPILMPWVL